MRKVVRNISFKQTGTHVPITIAEEFDCPHDRFHINKCDECAESDKVKVLISF